MTPEPFQPGTYMKKDGSIYFAKPGRKQRVNAEQVARVYELQTAIRAAEREIADILFAAGHVSKASQDNARRRIWVDQGRVNIVHRGHVRGRHPRGKLHRVGEQQ